MYLVKILKVLPNPRTLPARLSQEENEPISFPPSEGERGFAVPKQTTDWSSIFRHRALSTPILRIALTGGMFLRKVETYRDHIVIENDDGKMAQTISLATLNGTNLTYKIKNSPNRMSEAARVKRLEMSIAFLQASMVLHHSMIRGSKSSLPRILSCSHKINFISSIVQTSNIHGAIYETVGKLDFDTGIYLTKNMVSQLLQIKGLKFQMNRELGELKKGTLKKIGPIDETKLYDVINSELDPKDRSDLIEVGH